MIECQFNGTVSIEDNLCTFSMAGLSRLVLFSASEGQKLAPHEISCLSVIVLFAFVPNTWDETRLPHIWPAINVID